MNDLIKQLASDYIVHERFSRYGESTEEDYYEFYPDELEEFVAKIVEECAEFARQHNLEKADRSHLIHKAIKKHFGVKDE